MSRDDQEEVVGLKAVVQAVRLCEAVRKRISESELRHRAKPDGSPVTIADFGAQAVVCKILREAFPGDPVVAEENSTELRKMTEANISFLIDLVIRQTGETRETWWDSVETIYRLVDHGIGKPAGRFWTLDPIDGTNGFLSGGAYAVALALIENGKVRLGFMACPAMSWENVSGLIFMARAGADGARALTLDGMSVINHVRVRYRDDLTNATLLESVAFDPTNTLYPFLKKSAGLGMKTALMESQAKYCGVALGLGDVYLRAPNLGVVGEHAPQNIWDHAAGCVILEASGGRVTDLRGDPLDWTQGRRLEKNLGVLATNGHLHDRIVTKLRWLLGYRSG